MFDEKIFAEGKEVHVVNLLNSNEEYEYYGQLEIQFLTDAPMNVIDEIIEEVCNETEDVSERVEMVGAMIDERGYVYVVSTFNEREIGDV